MKYPMDLTGYKFKRLTPIKEVRKNGRIFWECVCDCGNTKTIRRDSLIAGTTVSCGCYNVDRAKRGENRRAHGMVGTHFYACWYDMKRRCENENYKYYNYYGGRGIKFTDKWDKFEGFMEDMYESYIEHINKHGEKDTTLDRIDTNGNYNKNNCRWATRKIQVMNRRNKVAMNAYSPSGDVYKNIYDISKFCKEHNLNKVLVYKCVRGEAKIHKGWKFEKVE